MVEVGVVLFLVGLIESPGVALFAGLLAVELMPTRVLV